MVEVIALNGLRRHAEQLAIQEWGPNALRPIGPHLAALCPLRPPCDLQRRWHVVHTEPQQEIKVAERVDAAHMDAYLPKEPKSVRINTVKRRTILRPMLPGYVFVGFDIRFDPWESICDMRGVLKLFMIALRPVPIPDKAIDRIREKEVETLTGKRRLPVIAFKIGGLVQIIEHLSFQGLLGPAVDIIRAKQRLVVELDIFGQKTPVELSVDQVRAI